MDERITAADVWTRLDNIRAFAQGGHIAEAHAAEAELHADTLRSIASWGDTESRTVARLALTSADIDFPRGRT